MTGEAVSALDAATALRPITIAWSAFVTPDSSFPVEDEVVHEDEDEPAQHNPSDITQ